MLIFYHFLRSLFKVITLRYLVLIYYKAFESFLTISLLTYLYLIKALYYIINNLIVLNSFKDF